MLFQHPFLRSSAALAALMSVALLGEASTGLASRPTDLLNRADTLRNRGKMVQALTLYRSAMAEAISGCEMARAHVGMGGIQWNAGNISEAKPHLDQAAQTCGTCPTHIRTGISLELARLMVVCGNTQEALQVLEREMHFGPAATQLAEVQLARVELHFVEGHWEEVWNATASMEGPRAEGLRIQAGAMIGHPISHLPLETYLRTTKPSERSIVLSELTHLHTMLSGSGRMQEALDLARGMVSLSDPIADAEDWTVAQLRVAVSAERAGKPLEALLAFHEAGRAAELVKDISLRARIAREQARFERERGATKAALEHLALADSLTVAMLHNVHQDREPRQFQSFPVLSDDPFELAAAEAMRPTASPGAWPFACALILLGLIAAALRANELKRALRKERVRAFRMQRMMHMEGDPFATEEDDLSGLGVTESGNVEEILTRPDRLDFDDVIASLEMDHGTAVEWEFEGNHEGQNAPDGLLSLLSVTLKRLLEGDQSGSFAGRIKNDWHGIHVEIEGPETPSTRELQRMFAGGAHSSAWNPVLVQIEKLAGRFTVEKRPSGELALTFLLPHSKS